MNPVDYIRGKVAQYEKETIFGSRTENKPQSDQNLSLMQKEKEPIAEEDVDDKQNQ